MVSSPQVKINPAVLTWAREWFNMSTAYVAKKMGQKEETIIAWENGEKQPTYKQLKKLSDLLKKPLEVFLYPNVPDIPKPSAIYRSAYGTSADALPPEILLIVHQAEIYQNNLREATHGQNPAEHHIRDCTFPEDIFKTADKVRELLGISLETQKEIGKSKSKDTWRDAFELWRYAFAKCGIYVYKFPFKNTDYSGFCLTDREFPIICVNNTMGHQRQTFTLFHELYHLIQNINGIDLTTNSSLLQPQDNTKHIEKKCDIFAAAFLVPNDDIREEIAKIPNYQELLSKGDLDEIRSAIVEPLAKKYSVSRDTILRKLSENRYITKEMSYSAYRRYKPDIYRDNDSTGGGDYYRNQVTYLGRPYIYLVMESQYKYGFPDYVAAEYLLTPASKLSDILEKAMKGGN